MFAMFVNYLGTGSGSSVNPFIKAVAYVCAVIVLIKGSGTVMRYFGVDIGLKKAMASLLQHLAWELCCFVKEQVV